MNFGIIGTNFISDWFVSAAKQVDGAEIKGVYSRQLDTGRAFAGKHGIENVYTSLDDMLSCSEIEAVYVASPTFMHKEHSIACLKAKKHVICEKMIAVNYSELLEMKVAARESGRILVEAMRPAFDPALEVIRENMKRLGKIRRVCFEFCQYSSRYDRFKGGEVLNAFDPKMNNSALADIGIYPLYFLTELFGECTELTSESVFLENGFEGCGNVLLKYPEMSATVSYSKISDSFNPSIIEGEEGTLAIDKISTPAKITLKLRGKDAEVINMNRPDTNMVYEVAEFIRLAKGEGDYTRYLEVSEKTMRTVDKIYRTSGFSTPYTVS